jgi:hypothetical protein
MIRNKDYYLDTRGGYYDAVEVPDKTGNAVANRIITSIVIAQGSYIADEKFGSKISDVKKASNYAELALKRHIENALDYTASDGSFKVLDVSVSVDTVAGIAAFSVVANYDGKNITVTDNINI